MDGTTRQDRWTVVGETVCGASHRRVGQKNQDAILWNTTDTGAPPVVLALSDGHGSAKCFRSHQGARIAVYAARMLVKQFLEGEWQGCGLSIIKRTVEERLPRELVRLWQGAVSEHLR